MNKQFFANTDGPAEGLPRELVGYGEHPPRIRWKNGAKVAVQIVVNYEEGSEKSFPMGDGQNDFLHEIPCNLPGIRDMAVESVYEYGSRAGIWRLFRVFDRGVADRTWLGAPVRDGALVECAAQREAGRRRHKRAPNRSQTASALRTPSSWNPKPQ